MKVTIKIISTLLIVCMLLSALISCTPQEQEPEEKHIDYAASVKLDMTSSSLKQEVTLKAHIDGDTTHFYVPTSVMEDGIIKARYLAINTPESTGKIEEWGKAASSFTKEKLASATSIVIESDDGKWNADSTGDRYLVWVWYKTADSAEYRNLNIEILQNGLAIASNSAQNRYGETCLAAIAQAQSEKLCVHSGQKDPEFFYGDAIELTLNELRANIEEYDGSKVAFNGIITQNYNNGVFVESYDAESDMYNGMYIYYGFNMSGGGLEILTVGNEVRIVGTVSFYEGSGSYQVSGLSYRAMKPDDPNNIQKLSDGHSPAYVLTTPETFTKKDVKITVGDEEKTFEYAKLAMNSSIKMEGLKVKSCYTTTDSESSNGALTLTCEANGVEISVRTTVLYDDNGNLITKDSFEGKTIDVKGIVDYFNGNYQIKVLSINDIDIKN